MKVVAMIPARMGSSRFPGKPLATIGSMSMIEHIFKRCQLCANVDEVYVATCDKEIQDAVHAFGGQAIMTSSKHERASDRIAEATAALEDKPEIIVMVQGDEPMITPEMLSAAIQPLKNGEASVVNLMASIDTEAEFLSSNSIKVVVDKNSNALYFSRSPIPNTEHGRREQKGFGDKQVCIIPFLRETLLAYTSWDATSLEIAESVDMMRFLENGVPVKMVRTDVTSYAVDTPDDLAFVTEQMQDDPLVKSYS